MSQQAIPFQINHIKRSKTTKAARIAIANANTRPLGYQYGQAAGSLFLKLGIPARYIEEMTGNIIDDWKFSGWRFKENWKRNESFLKGREDAYRRITGTYHDILSDYTRSNSPIRLLRNSFSINDDQVPFESFLKEAEEAAYGQSTLLNGAFRISEPSISSQMAFEDFYTELATTAAAGTGHLSLHQSPVFQKEELSDSDCMIIDEL